MDEEIKAINNLIVACVIHGGDAGGAYATSLHLVEKYANAWLTLKGYDNEYEVREIANHKPEYLDIGYFVFENEYYGAMPQIVKRRITK